MHTNPHESKAPEDWRTPRRFAGIRIRHGRASVLERDSPPPLFLAAQII